MTEASQESLIGSATAETTPTPENPESAPDPTPEEPTTAEEPSVEAEGAAEDGLGQSSAAPISIEDITVPEGFDLPEETGGAFVELLNNPPESRAEFANALLGIHTSLLEEVAGQYAEQWESTQEDWRTQVQNLPEIGGKNLDQSLAEIAKVMDRYGDQEARDALAMTGAGNHPALVRLFHAIAKDTNEAPPVAGESATGAPRDRASRMFGST